MAYVGLARPVVARYSEEGGERKYSDGIRYAKAIKILIDPHYEDVSDYNDINDTDEVKEFAYADITLNTSDTPEAAETMMFGHEVSGGTVISRGMDRSGYVGLGARIRVIENGRARYVALWIHKAKFEDGSQEYETKDNSFVYKTPTTEGKAILDITGEWRTKKTFNTAKEADAWIDATAGIEREV